MRNAKILIIILLFSFIAAFGEVTSNAVTVNSASVDHDQTTNVHQDVNTTGTPQFAREGVGKAAHASHTVDVLSTSVTDGSAGVNVSHTGAVTGTGYGALISKTGASTTNVGLSLSATGATSNVALELTQGHLTAANNVGIGITGWGTNSNRVLGIGDGTPPTTRPIDMCQTWAQGFGPGDSRQYFMSEGSSNKVIIGKGYIFCEGGMIRLKEITTPTPFGNFGSIYPKADDNLYFQDGAGTEHVVAVDQSKVNTFNAHTNSVVFPISTTDSDHAVETSAFTTSATASFTDSATFAIGDTGAITVFADAGGGQVTVTSAGHGLSNGTYVTINGTTNYNGLFLVANVSTDTFEITDTWVADDATGTWHEPDLLTMTEAGKYKISYAASVIAASPNTTFHFHIYVNGTELDSSHTGRRFSSTDLGSVSGFGYINAVVGDKIYLAVENITDATDITFEDFVVGMHKI
jgi:hypothetical protein